MIESQASPAELRPRGIGELLDASVKAAIRHFRALALCVLIVAVPIGILSTLVDVSTTNGAYDFSTATTTYDSEGAYLTGRLITVVLSIVAFALATGACLQIVGSDVLGGKATAGASLRAAFSRLGGLIGVSIFYGILLFVGIILLILPGIWIGIAAALATPALFFERLGPWQAIGRSVNLVSGRWWRTFAVLLVLGLLLTILQAALGALFGAAILADSSNETLNATILTAVNIFGQVLTLPIAAAAIAFIYFDARVRKEGFDLQLLAGRIQGDGPVAQPPAPSGAAGFPPPGPAPSEGFLAPEPPPDR